MNKTDLINKVSELSGWTKKDSTKAVETVMQSITEGLQNNETIQIIGFGNFQVKERPARKGRNPQTGETIQIKASKVPSFKPGKNLKEAVNG